MLSFESLKVEFISKMELEEGEELTTANFNHGGLNFAIGTTFGSVYFGQIAKDHKSQCVKIAKLVGLAKTKENAVTSIQLS